MKLFLVQEAGVNRNAELHAILQGRSIFFLIKMLSSSFSPQRTIAISLCIQGVPRDSCLILYHSGNVCSQAETTGH